MRWKRKAKSALWDYLKKIEPQHVANHLERESQTAESGEEFLRQVILSAVYQCVGDFLRSPGDEFLRGLGRVSPDLIAFEALAFAFYAIRKSHLPTPADPLDDDEPAALVDAYRFIMGGIPLHVEKFTGWDVGDIWQRQVMAYFQRPSIRDASDLFVGRLLTAGDAAMPLHHYGKIKLSFELNTSGRLKTHIWASTMPKASAEIIQNIVSMYGLAD